MTIPEQWCHRQTGHLLIHVDRNLERKYVLTNAYTQTSFCHCYNVSVVPVYDDYNILFDKCDKFNKRLHHCTWPHKSGGRNSLGDLGCQNNFAMSCMLQNVFNAWFQVNDIDSHSVDFSTNFMLSNEIYTFATTLVE